MEDVRKRIYKVFMDALDLDEDIELNDEIGTDDLEEWDSLSSMALSAALEKEFSIKFSFEDIIEMETLGDIEKVVKSHL